MRFLTILLLISISTAVFADEAPLLPDTFFTQFWSTEENPWTFRYRIDGTYDVSMNVDFAKISSGLNAQASLMGISSPPYPRLPGQIFVCYAAATKNHNKRHAQIAVRVNGHGETYTGSVTPGGSSYNGNDWNHGYLDIAGLAFGMLDKPGWRQTDPEIRDIRWGYNRPQQTVRTRGCSAVAALNAIGWLCWPFTMNPQDCLNWLYDNDGWSGNLLIWQKIVEWVNSSGGYFIGLRSNLPLDEALHRECAAVLPVHNRGHWVAVVAHEVGTPSGHHMQDPMESVRHYNGHLESYWGISTTNTRCFYLRRAVPFRGLLVASAGSGVGDSTSEIDWGASGIQVEVSKGIEASIWQDGQRLGILEVESLEDPDTGQLEENSVQTWEDQGLPAGTVMLKLKGVPGTSYNGVFRSFDERTQCKRTPFAGILPESGEVTLGFSHDPAAVFYNTFQNLVNLPVGTFVMIMEGATVTAKVPNGVYVQPLDGFTPSLKVTFDDHTYIPYEFNPGDIVTLMGRIAEDENHSKSLAATSVIAESYNSYYWPTIIPGVETERVATTFHLLVKTWGIVSDVSDEGFAINGLPVKMDVVPPTILPGRFVTATGVWHEGVFYACYAEDPENPYYF